jgi:lipoprotein NlpI
MRIQNDDTNEPIRAVWLYLTASEAEHLAETLTLRLREGDEEHGPSWHHHIESSDGDQEVTVMLYPDGEPPPLPSN